MSPEEVLRHFDVSPEQGLDASEVNKRKKAYGSNRLKPQKPKSAWGILFDQVKNFIVLLLAVAAVLSFLFGQWLEGVAIVAAIMINVAIGFFTELRAVRSMEALRRMSRIKARVLRRGRLVEIPSEDIVAGDMVLLEGGDVGNPGAVAPCE